MDSISTIENFEGKPIRELINELMDLEVQHGSDTKVTLKGESQGYEPDGEEGNIDYEPVGKLYIHW